MQRLIKDDEERLIVGNNIKAKGLKMWYFAERDNE